MTGFEFVWVLLGGGIAGAAIGYRWAMHRISRELADIETEDAQLQAWLDGFDPK